jgi:hypothetical protein
MGRHWPHSGAIVIHFIRKARAKAFVSLRTAAALSALVALASPSLGQQQGTQEERDACTPDAFKLCGEFVPDADKITACLKQKKNELSPACKVVFSGKPKQQASGGSNIIPGRRGSVR